MNLLNFVSQYPDESSCRAKLKAYRDSHGVICPDCVCGGDCSFIGSAIECRVCGHPQSLRVNTVMRGSKLLVYRYPFVDRHKALRIVFQLPNYNVNWVITDMNPFGTCFINCVRSWAGGMNGIPCQGSLN
jgi:hypothetical protein